MDYPYHWRSDELGVRRGGHSPRRLRGLGPPTPGNCCLGRARSRKSPVSRGGERGRGPSAPRPEPLPVARQGPRQGTPRPQGGLERVALGRGAGAGVGRASRGKGRLCRLADAPAAPLALRGHCGPGARTESQGEGMERAAALARSSEAPPSARRRARPSRTLGCFRRAPAAGGRAGCGAGAPGGGVSDSGRAPACDRLASSSPGPTRRGRRCTGCSSRSRARSRGGAPAPGSSWNRAHAFATEESSPALRRGPVTNRLALPSVRGVRGGPSAPSPARGPTRCPPASPRAAQSQKEARRGQRGVPTSLRPPETTHRWRGAQDSTCAGRAVQGGLDLRDLSVERLLAWLRSQWWLLGLGRAAPRGCQRDPD